MFPLFKNRNGFNSPNQMMSNSGKRIFSLFLGKGHCQGLCLQIETDLIISRKDPLILALSSVLLKMNIQFCETGYRSILGLFVCLFLLWSVDMLLALPHEFVFLSKFKIQKFIDISKHNISLMKCR